MTDTLADKARGILRDALGPDAEFRPGQLEAILALVQDRRRVLIVQRTGWGKSVVYFIATRLLRDMRSGPTLLISPLLALMRDQTRLAGMLGVKADTINSSNRQDWQAIDAKIQANAVDLVLVSPERLAAKTFRENLKKFISNPGMLVIDEAHCISDWGHDFRPDYRRIIEVVGGLPAGAPVLATTATANDRVVSDVRGQMGKDLAVFRGPLARESLTLQVMPVQSAAERLAWLTAAIPKLEGSGIIYCLTVRDVRRVAAWLKERGIRAEAYHASEGEELNRPELERLLHDNSVKVLVATVALGMGFDKADLAFVIHFQSPGSVVAYYQQIGRAGRAIPRASVILLRGAEDRRILEYFIESACPTERSFAEILSALSSEMQSSAEVLSRLNMTRSVFEQALKILAVEGVVDLSGVFPFAKVARTGKEWTYDCERIARLKRQRYEELAQMEAYAGEKSCLMGFLLRALDDDAKVKCGSCANCIGREPFSFGIDAATVGQAEDFLSRETIEIPAKTAFPKGVMETSDIPREFQNQPGRALCHYGDGRLGGLVQEGKYKFGKFDKELVLRSADLIRSWKPQPPPMWITAIPSHRHPKLVADFAASLAASLNLPFKPLVRRSTEAPEQKTMQNGTNQAKNVLTSLDITEPPPSTPVLLLDDIVDSGWTLAVAGLLLRQKGSGPVFPFALARASMRRSYQ